MEVLGEWAPISCNLDFHQNHTDHERAVRLLSHNHLLILAGLPVGGAAADPNNEDTRDTVGDRLADASNILDNTNVYSDVRYTA